MWLSHTYLFQLQVFEWMITKLEKLGSQFATNLLFELKCRIIERRQSVASTLLAYLENPKFLDSTAGLKLEYSDREAIAQKIERLFLRLFSDTTVDSDVEDIDEPDIVE